MSLRLTRAEAAEFLTAVLGIWVGIYAFRTFVPTAVWNLSATLPLYLKGALAIGVHVIGIAGCLLPFTRHQRAVGSLAIAVAIVGVLRQIFLGSDALGATFSLAGWVFWLWWLAAYARRLGDDRAHIIAPAVAVAFAFQVGMQAAWHGLDLPVARGAIAVACALTLHALFVLVSIDDARSAAPGRARGGSYAFVALGAVLFLELTYFANVGRAGVISGLGIVPATLIIQAALLAGALLALLPRRRLVLYALALGLVAVTLQRTTLTTLVFGQIAIVMLTASAATRRARTAPRAFTVGMVVLFALLFLFYNRYEWPALWLAGALVLALSALPPGNMQRLPATYALMGVGAMLLTLGGAIGPVRSAPARARESLQFLTYNIYAGFNAAGVPGMQATAAEIERMDPDIVVLQEVVRGWTFVGGADVVAYLRHRFPDYRIHYVPVNGQLWGVALMSRLPLSDVRGQVFPADPGVFRYGFVQGTVHAGTLPIRVTGVHLSAGPEGGGSIARDVQVEHLVDALDLEGDAIVGGDLNAYPGDQPVQRLLSVGFADAGAAVGLGQRNTWPARSPTDRIDYVFMRGKLEAVAGDIAPTTASDHLPVLVRLRIRN